MTTVPRASNPPDCLHKNTERPCRECAVAVLHGEPMPIRTVQVVLSIAALLAAGGARSAEPAAKLEGGAPASTVRAVVVKYCADCHGADASKGGLNLEKLLPDDLARHSDAWGKVIRKLRARHMPPIGKPRPDEATFDAVIAALEQPLDRAAAAQPMAVPASGGVGLPVRVEHGFAATIHAGSMPSSNTTRMKPAFIRFRGARTVCVSLVCSTRPSPSPS